MLYQIVCGNCGKQATKKRSDGIPPVYCSRDCWRVDHKAKKREMRTDTNNYWTLHQRIENDRGRARDQSCTHCPKQAHDWAQIHGTPGTRPEHYQPLCRGCHLQYDMTDEKRAKLAAAADRRVRDSGRFT